MNSVIRKNLPIFDDQKWKKDLGIAMEVFVNDLDVREPRIYLGVVNIGYGWIFPNRNKAIVGLGGLIKKENFIEKFRSFVSKFGLKSLREIKGHLVPYGNFIEKPVFGNTLLVGDAAGFANPLTGEGIFYAHKSGELAARSIYFHLKENQNLEKVYGKLLRKYLLRRLKYAKKVRKMFFKTAFAFQYFPFRLFLRLFQDKIVDAVHKE